MGKAVSRGAAIALAGCVVTAPAVAGTEFDGGPVRFTLGGYLQAVYGADLADNTPPGSAGYDRQQDRLQEDLALNGAADADLAPGLDTRLYLQLREQNTPDGGGARQSDNITQLWVRLRDADWGEIRLGRYTDARRATAYVSPQLSGDMDNFLGVNSPNTGVIANMPIATNTTTAVLDDRATKLVYFSPKEAGFQLAFTYAPEQHKGHRIDGDRIFTAPGLPAGTTGGKLDDLYSTAVTWDGEIDEVSIQTAAGFTGASHRDGPAVVPGLNEADPFAWDVGGQASYGPWRFGAAYEQQHHFNSGLGGGIYGPGVIGAGDDAFNRIVNKTFDIGLTYSIGPVTVGGNLSRGAYEGLADPADVKRASYLTVSQIGVNYLVRPGINVQIALQYAGYDANGAYVPLPAGYTTTIGDPAVASNTNVFAKNDDAVNLLFGTEVKF